MQDGSQKILKVINHAVLICFFHVELELNIIRFTHHYSHIDREGLLFLCLLMVPNCMSLRLVLLLRCFFLLLRSRPQPDRAKRNHGAGDWNVSAVIGVEDGDEWLKVIETKGNKWTSPTPPAKQAGWMISCDFRVPIVQSCCTSVIYIGSWWSLWCYCLEDLTLISGPQHALTSIRLYSISLLVAGLVKSSIQRDEPLWASTMSMFNSKTAFFCFQATFLQRRGDGIQLQK